jgi:hypothetical protein
VGLGVNNVVKSDNKVKLKEIQLKDTSAELKQLEIKYDHLNIELDKVDKTKTEDIKRLEQEKIELQKQKEELERQVSAKKEAQRIATEKANKAAQTVSAVVAPKASAMAAGASTGNCGDNMYKQYIYQHESGCDTNRYNSIGCYGIGQSCPANKIAHCGADFACQDAWFTQYANSRYGGWQQAYEAWLVQRWW